MKSINSFIIIAIALVVIGCDKGFPDDDESILPTRTFRYSDLFTKYYSLNISFVSPDGMDLLAPFINTEDGCIDRGQYSLIYILPDGSYKHQINVNDSELISYSGRYYMPATYRYIYNAADLVDIISNLTYRLDFPSLFGDYSAHYFVANWIEDLDDTKFAQCSSAFFDDKEIVVKKDIIYRDPYAPYKEHCGYFIDIVLDK